MRHPNLLVPLACACALALAVPAQAQEAGDWTFSIGAHAVSPKSDNGRLAGGALAADEDGPAERPARDQPRKLPVVFLVVRSVRDRQKHDLGRGGRAGIDEV